MKIVQKLNSCAKNINFFSVVIKKIEIIKNSCQVNFLRLKVKIMQNHLFQFLVESTTHSDALDAEEVVASARPPVLDVDRAVPLGVRCTWFGLVSTTLVKKKYLISY